MIINELTAIHTYLLKEITINQFIHICIVIYFFELNIKNIKIYH